MKKRQELIDFINWFEKKYDCIGHLEGYDFIDEYLESINSGLNETQAIRHNEHTKEVFVNISSVTCPNCGKRFDNIYDSFHACNKK